ncbi:hypothetical protein NFHSH190041_20090 [Shewanella sp. NFH-SH190041]|uniref:hypothetical protein n=1 Tax=Shewanella sp. NFH-SH190041 TaxID=2950245 RepID=UPI0021C48E00|nr:hypothetical protein [Shewanella sp. NFH-SH190041]BDM64557.1 hypothetical protein NFHSH190041_20090 [Shewanella sp. NFH-SH190041]
MFTKLHEWQGRLIAYLGGGSVSAYSYDAAAKAGEVNQLIVNSLYPYDYRLISMIISVCGLLVVVVRLGWDIWTYFDKRKQGRADE